MPRRRENERILPHLIRYEIEVKADQLTKWTNVTNRGTGTIDDKKIFLKLTGNVDPRR